ncbi:MAG: toll/interleukin-1 receptor domain-containing protein [Bacteroidales bacterium]|nr:toll/interleukin-1 receptor domain-containing protein [Bacteroidales bacterium]
MDSQFKYFAFISYNSKDTEWGKKVQKKLEHYRMPATLCSEHGWKRRPINPVFFAPTDIQPGGLSAELQERLKASQHLIVICSPNSAKSQWVGREIEYFHNLGRTNNIHFFIVKGSPHSGDPATECFNPVVDKLRLPEILGANINEHVYRLPWLNRERAFVQLVSKLLGVEFDTIWQRHKRRLVRKVLAWTIASIVVLSALIGVWRLNQPIDVETQLNETSVHNPNLPPLHKAIVTMSLDNETKTDTIQTMQSKIVFSNIPHRFLNKQVRFTVTCRDFIGVDTVVTLSKNVILDVKRDPSVYGNVHFLLYDPDKETGVADTKLEINGYEITTDENGYMSLFIPLESQNKYYKIKTQIGLYNDTIFMPCGESDVIMTKK